MLVLPDLTYLIVGLNLTQDFDVYVFVTACYSAHQPSAPCLMILPWSYSIAHKTNRLDNSFHIAETSQYPKAIHDNSLFFYCNM
jgi:hypothetical protein